MVLGGSGFVGSNIVKEALNSGLAVVSVNRSGPPKGIKEPWVDQVKWVRGDALKPETYASTLEGALGAISTVGAFGSNEFMRKVCGEANVLAIQTAKERGVPRFCFISAHDFRIPGLLTGYYAGKKDAERALFEHYPEGGVALRPGFIYGTRVLASGTQIPLGIIGAPLRALLVDSPLARVAKGLSGVPVAGAAFVPPVSVEAVARAAVAAATDPSVPAGPMDVYALTERYGK